MQELDVNELLTKFRYPLLILLVGAILIGGGILFFKSGIGGSGTKVEVLGDSTTSDTSKVITAEIAGEVLKPGVYKLPDGSRVDDLLVVGGGLTASADREWTDKYLNRASKITDGQKVYIPAANEQSGVVTANNSVVDQNGSSSKVTDSSKTVNINTASLNQLDSLPGIGQVYGQSIIEHRPYSTVEELVSKGAIKQSLFTKIKDQVSVY